MRPSWEEYFLGIAQVVAQRSTCDRAYVGCVLVRDKRILTTGYNGSPSSLEHCDDVGHLLFDGHCIRTLHAEQNAIIQAALHGVSTKGAECFVTHHPCVICAKMLINAGVWRVVYLHDYANARGDEFFRWAKIQVEQMKGNE
jgi:dCMP deaminase